MPCVTTFNLDKFYDIMCNNTPYQFESEFYKLVNDIDNKVNAFLKYKSQVKKFPHPRSKEAIVNLSRVRGGQAFVEYAEAFRVEKILD